ncbi:MAG: LysM peptidoglycan-binding domain-containing protein [Treponema sp.]|nr:LysM peptidoglycan-binding domain-containing protein [Treponema sp.]
MSRSIAILSAILLLFGATSVFARAASETLPEPALHENTGGVVSPSAAPSGWFPELDEAVSWLWNFGAADTAGYVEYQPSQVLAQAATGDADIPASIRNNKYFVESVRLTLLAQQAYDDGDYDASAQYSEDAIRYAHLSDEYVQLQLKIRQTDDAIAAAKSRLDYAASVNAAARYPVEYSQAQTAFTEARTLRAAQSWDDAIAAANRVLVALANVSSEQKVAEGPIPLPAQYTVRPWSTSKDCLWNIAGRPYVYNDPKKWKVLYDANKAKMPQPNNPDLIHPGMIMDIPSIKGETRQGMWDAGKTYSPLK